MFRCTKDYPVVRQVISEEWHQEQVLWKKNVKLDVTLLRISIIILIQ